MLSEILRERRQQIIGDWFSKIIETYPANAADFLMNQKDQFANPVGSTISREIEALFDELAGSMDAAKVSASIESLMKLRSVQDFSASQAVGIILLLKDCVRNLSWSRLTQGELASELLSFESRVDRAVLVAFDSYSKCRESLNELKLKEMKARSIKLTERVAKAGGVDFNEI